MRAWIGRLLAAACGLMASAACRAEAPPLPPHVLLIAVGDEQPVFDRFVADLARRFDALDVAGVATASSSGKVGRRLDATDDVYAAIRGMRGGDAPASGGGCLLYLTGHGTRAGLSMPLGAASTPPSTPDRPYAALRPRALEAALRQGCGDAPTVVVASACYSGVYLGRLTGLRGANRVVLTAAAADRTSFGCADDQTHTYYDGCFLRVFDEAQATASTPTTWRELAGRTAACVAERERTLLPPGSPPSNPQSYVGSAVEGLALPRGR